MKTGHSSGPVALLAALLLAAAPLAAHPPYGIAIDAAGRIHLMDLINRRVLRVSPEGRVTELAALGKLTQIHPHQVAPGPDGGLYVPATYESRIWRVDPEAGVAAWNPGRLQEGIGEDHVVKLAWDPGGRLHLVTCRVREMPDGRIVDRRYGVLVGRPDSWWRTRYVFRRQAPDFRSLYAGGLAAAEDGTLYLAVPHAVLRLSPKDGLEVMAGSEEKGFADGEGEAARFASPWGLCLMSDGRLVVVDHGNRRLRVLDTTGRVSTLAGSGERGGRDGPAAEARFDQPYAAAGAPDGSLVVAEQADLGEERGHGHRLRRVKDGQVSTIAVIPGR